MKTKKTANARAFFNILESLYDKEDQFLSMIDRNFLSTLAKEGMTLDSFLTSVCSNDSAYKDSVLNEGNIEKILYAFPPKQYAKEYANYIANISHDILVGASDCHEGAENLQQLVLQLQKETPDWLDTLNAKNQEGLASIMILALIYGSKEFVATHYNKNKKLVVSADFQPQLSNVIYNKNSYSNFQSVVFKKEFDLTKCCRTLEEFTFLESLGGNGNSVFGLDHNFPWANKQELKRIIIHLTAGQKMQKISLVESFQRIPDLEENGSKEKFKYYLEGLIKTNSDKAETLRLAALLQPRWVMNLKEAETMVKKGTVDAFGFDFNDYLSAGYLLNAFDIFKTMNKSDGPIKMIKGEIFHSNAVKDAHISRTPEEVLIRGLAVLGQFSDGQSFLKGHFKKDMNDYFYAFFGSPKKAKEALSLLTDQQKSSLEKAVSRQGKLDFHWKTADHYQNKSIVQRNLKFIEFVFKEISTSKEEATKTITNQKMMALGFGGLRLTDITSDELLTVSPKDVKIMTKRLKSDAGMPGKQDLSGDFLNMWERSQLYAQTKSITPQVQKNRPAL